MVFWARRLSGEWEDGIFGVRCPGEGGLTV